MNAIDLQAVADLLEQAPSTPKGSRLPTSVQEVVAEHLRAGVTIAETARRCGVSRDQVRTVRYAMAGLTLRQVRTLKRELKA